MMEGGSARMKVQWMQAFYNIPKDGGKSCAKFCDVG